MSEENGRIALAKIDLLISVLQEHRAQTLQQIARLETKVDDLARQLGSHREAEDARAVDVARAIAELKARVAAFGALFGAIGSFAVAVGAKIVDLVLGR